MKKDIFLQILLYHSKMSDDGMYTVVSQHIFLSIIQICIAHEIKHCLDMKVDSNTFEIYISRASYGEIWRQYKTK